MLNRRDEIGQLANSAAQAAAFQTYKIDIAANTLDRQQYDLALFRTFIQSKTPAFEGDMFNDPSAWNGVTWGLVQAFVFWMLKQGYAIGSINVRLATIKRYAQLAFKSGTIDANDYALIKNVEGYRKGRVVDKKRVVTRIGAKKAYSTALSTEQRKALKKRIDNSAQSACYALLMCLLLDHGLRVSEALTLDSESINFTDRTITFYRQKVDKSDTHKLTPSTYDAALFYRPHIIDGLKLLRGSKRGKELRDTGMTRSGAEQILKRLGKRIGIEALSPHDCRHSWATEYEKKHSAFELRDAGGWSTMSMPNRYVERRTISNDGEEID